MKNLVIKQCSDKEAVTEALSPAWRVFLEYEASDCAPEEMENGFMTVNSSLYAIPVYHKLGFLDMDTMQNAGRMGFMPMRMEKYLEDRGG